MFNQGWQQYGNVINEIVTVGLGYKQPYARRYIPLQKGLKIKTSKGPESLFMRLQKGISIDRVNY